MKTKLMFVLFMLILFSGSAKAAPTTAASIKNFCSAFVANQEDGSISTARCVWYISGWAEGTVGTLVETKGKIFMVQFAENITPGQIIRVFFKFVNEHPELENENGLVVVGMALINAKLMVFVPVDKREVQ